MQSIGIIGLGSPIGHHLALALRDEGLNVGGTSHKSSAQGVKLDLTWPLKEWPELPNYDVVVICAGVSKLEECHRNPLKSFAVNVEGVEKLIEYFSPFSSKFVFISSAQVFSGEFPYYKDVDEPNPISEMGKQKARAEKQILLSGGLVVRLTKVVSPNFERFLSWFDALTEGQKIQAYENLNVSMVTLDDVVQLIVAAIKFDQNGVIHFSGENEISYADIALNIASRIGADRELIERVTGNLEELVGPFSHATLENSAFVDTVDLKTPSTDELISMWVNGVNRAILE